MSTTINVPSHMLADVQAFMESLAMNPDNATITPPKPQAEVKSITNFTNTNNKYNFQLLFKDGSSEWVADEDTNCEQLISEYLHGKGINTTYLLCRVSTKEQSGDTHVSLEAQEQELISFTNKQSIPNTRIKTIKITKSAYSGIPSEIKNIGECTQQGDNIYVYRIDRFSRNLIKYLDFMEETTNKGVTIYSLSENISYNNNKTQFIQGILDAQKESETIGKRIRLSIKHKLERGDKVGGLPYGKCYKRTATGKMVVVDKLSEQTIIKRIKRLSKSKTSLKNIATQLNEDGIRKKNKPWTASSVRSVLRLG